MFQDIQSITSDRTNGELSNDYENAAINVLWLREDQKRTIIFCSVELYPKEVENISKIDEISHTVKGVKNCGLYFQRYILSAEEALNWYQSSDHKMIWDEWNKDVVTDPKIYVEEPMELKFNVTNDLPFCIKSRESIRVCSKFSLDVASNVIEYLKQKDVKEWLSQNFIFDLTEYPEYICSINLIAYNPLFRKLNSQIVPNENGEGILFTLEKRENVSIDGLKLLYVEKRPTGYTDIRCEDILSDVIFIRSDGPIEQIAYAIFCSHRGLLAYNGFYSFVRSIGLDFNVAEKIKKVYVPQRNNLSEVKETLEVPLYHCETSEVNSEVFSKKYYQDLMNKLYKAQQIRAQKQKAACQKILYDDKQQLQEKARDFIRELVSKAKNEVWFIDPYFATHELFSFAETITRQDIEVHIVTSKLILDKKDSTCKFREYKQFEQEISKRENFDAYVMLGEQPIFHDRFIVIDKDVWLSGNSLGTIGERVSYIIRLENPRDFLSVFEMYKYNTEYIQPFGEWVKNKNGENA